MISLLAKIFCKPEGRTPTQLRTAYGILCGAVGIALNLLLFAGKLLAGTLSGSIAITADAFNNLSDAGSSIITLLGFKIAAKTPDPGHPFGHGRAEYLSGLAVSMLILLMGVELGKESIGKILHPEPVAFSALVLGILAVSVCVKLYMAFYNRAVGKRLDAPALLAVAADSGRRAGEPLHRAGRGWLGRRRSGGSHPERRHRRRQGYHRSPAGRTADAGVRSGNSGSGDGPQGNLRDTRSGGA